MIPLFTAHGHFRRSTSKIFRSNLVCIPFPHIRTTSWGIPYDVCTWREVFFWRTLFRIYAMALSNTQQFVGCSLAIDCEENKISANANNVATGEQFSSLRILRIRFGVHAHRINNLCDGMPRIPNSLSRMELRCRRFPFDLMENAYIFVRLAHRSLQHSHVQTRPVLRLHEWRWMQQQLRWRKKNSWKVWFVRSYITLIISHTIAVFFFSLSLFIYSHKL